MGLNSRDSKSCCEQEKPGWVQQGANSKWDQGYWIEKWAKLFLHVTSLNQQDHMKLMLLIDHNMVSGKATFGMVKNCKTNKYPEGNITIKFAPKTTPSLLKWKKDFEKVSSKMLKKCKITSVTQKRWELRSSWKWELVITEKEFIMKIFTNLPGE